LGEDVKSAFDKRETVSNIDCEILRMYNDSVMESNGKAMEEVNVPDDGTEVTSMAFASEPLMRMKNQNSTNLDLPSKKPFNRIDMNPFILCDN
jgi:hypothetical protein